MKHDLTQLCQLLPCDNSGDPSTQLSSALTAITGGSHLAKLVSIPTGFYVIDSRPFTSLSWSADEDVYSGYLVTPSATVARVTFGAHYPKVYGYINNGSLYTEKEGEILLEVTNLPVLEGSSFIGLLAVTATVPADQDNNDIYLNLRVIKGDKSIVEFESTWQIGYFTDTTKFESVIVNNINVMHNAGTSYFGTAVAGTEGYIPLYHLSSTRSEAAKFAVLEFKSGMNNSKYILQSGNKFRFRTIWNDATYHSGNPNINVVYSGSNFDTF